MGADAKLQSSGTCKAASQKERGSAGFSYDPIFEYPPAGRTFGELTEAEKNAVSHRARAARALLDTVDETPFPSNGGP